MTACAEFIGALGPEMSFKMWNDAFATWLVAIPAEIKLAVTVNTEPQDVWAQNAHSFPFPSAEVPISEHQYRRGRSHPVWHQLHHGSRRLAWRQI